MDIQTTRTIIIGAGLSGIYAASRLAETREAFIVLEARDRAGGRIQCREFKGYATDLGPSWYWPAINPRVKGLIQELGLTGYPQFDRGYGRFQAPDGSIRTIPGYPMAPEGWRLRGGMNALINGLLKTIPPKCLRLNHPVCEIEDRGGHVRVSVGKPGEAPQCRFDAARVILALPPRLAAASILFTPDLSPNWPRPCSGPAPGWPGRQNSLRCTTKQPGGPLVSQVRPSANAAPWERSMTAPAARPDPLA